MLNDLENLGDSLAKTFVSKYSHEDHELPDFFKVAYKNIISQGKFNLGYSSIEFHKYSAVITTSTNKTISVPNFWFVAANCFVPYILELMKYKKIIKEIQIESKRESSWPKGLKGATSLSFEKNDYESTRNLTNEEFQFVKKFITDYKWWKGGKTIDRGDYYVSPILKLGNFLAESQSAIAELAWQIGHIKDINISKQLSSKYGVTLSIALSSKSVSFDIESFDKSLTSSQLKIQRNLSLRFASALLAKPFVILTGLSGSGKTKLAEAFSLWITLQESQNAKYVKGQKILAPQAKYIIEDTDRLGVVIKSQNATKTFLPYDLIELWADVIVKKALAETVGSQEIQKLVLDNGIEHSSTLNSFHSQLKALAFEYLKFSKEKINRPQTCLVSVGADWTNREPLLGFPNALEKGQYVKPDSGALDLLINAQNDPSKPYFLILDEMNMSHVERYFADFLSAMESISGEIALHPDTDDWNDCDVPATIKLPKNLFIIGTVNIDETTYMFSPKVLDRANVIEFRVSENEMKSYFTQPTELDLDSLKGKGASMAESFVAKSYERGLMTQGLEEELMPFFTELQKVGAEFGYRTASEISRFVRICKDMSKETKGNTMTRDEIIDAAIIQKLLPKLHGSRSKIEKVLKILIGLCETDDESKSVKYTLSHEKLNRMHQRVIADGFTSFAEA